MENLTKVLREIPKDRDLLIENTEENEDLLLASDEACEKDRFKDFWIKYIEDIYGKDVTYTEIYVTWDGGVLIRGLKKNG